MNLLTIIGARPQFVKAAPFSRAAKEAGISEALLHTGQHYDYQMSEVFFEEMGIPKPKFNLEIAGGHHGSMTGKMLIAIEEVLLSEKPNALLVYGDTNSTLAGALAAAKLSIPIVHVEAGLRSWNREMPEEINRVMTDHLSSQLFCSSAVGIENLAAEGISREVYAVGDIMADANRLARELVSQAPEKYLDPALPRDVVKNGYSLMTLHRAENTDHESLLEGIVKAVNQHSKPVVVPLHPRTKKKMKDFGLTFGSNVTVLDPVGYLGMVSLINYCEEVMTDSGGLQKEAYWMEKPCLTLRTETEWVETVEEGRNILWNPKLPLMEQVPDLGRCESQPFAYGDGNTAIKIAAKIRNLFQS